MINIFTWFRSYIGLRPDEFTIITPSLDVAVGEKFLILGVQTERKTDEGQIYHTEIKTFPLATDHEEEAEEINTLENSYHSNLRLVGYHSNLRLVV